MANYLENEETIDKNWFYQLEETAQKSGINLHIPTEPALTKIQQNQRLLQGKFAAPPDINTRELSTAASFYYTLLKPFLATGRDAFKPEAKDIIELCQDLVKKQADFVIYMFLSKTRSPSRTGSPDALIDFAELEMFKGFSLLTKVAEQLNLKLRFIFLDEASGIPTDSISKISPLEQVVNLQTISAYLNKLGTSSQILVKRLYNSIINPLGLKRANQLFKDKISANQELFWQSAQEANHSPEDIRLRVILEIIPPEVFLQRGIPYNLIENIINNNLPITNLYYINQDLYFWLISFAAQFKTLMDLRINAAQVVREQGLEEIYPEHNGTIKSGITRNRHRWSFIPLVPRVGGRTVLPMHGLAVYTNSNQEKVFQGILPYRKGIEAGYLIIRSRENKPLFMLKS